MSAEMTAIKLSSSANSQSNYNSQSNIQQSQSSIDNNEFVSSLQQQSRRKQGESSSKLEQNQQTRKQNRTSDQINSRQADNDQAVDKSRNQSDDLKIEGQELENLSQEKLEKLKKLLAKDLDKLSDKDVEALLANLSKIFEKLSQELKQNLGNINNKEQIKQLVESITANQEQLQKLMDNFNTEQSDKFKSLLQELKSIQDELLLKQSQNNQMAAEKSQQAAEKEVQTDLKNTMQDLKKLLQDTNAKVVESNSSGSKSSQNLANQKILSQFNLVKPKRQEKETKQNSKSNFSTIDLEKLGKKIGQNLAKQETVDLKNLDSDKQIIDFKAVTNKNNVDLDVSTLNNLKLGQFNTNSEVFNQSAVTNARTAKTLELQNIISQLNNKMDFNAIKQGNKITMQLEPEFLGKIQMKVGVEDGSVTAKILAENNGVKDLLNGNLIKLKSTLEQKGIQIDQFDVAVGYQEEELAEQNNSQQEFLFRQQQEKNRLKNFSLKLEEGQLSTSEMSAEEIDETTQIDDEVDYMA